MSASDGHVVDPNPEQQAYDVCMHCGKPIQLDVYGTPGYRARHARGEQS